MFEEILKKAEADEILSQEEIDFLKKEPLAKLTQAADALRALAHGQEIEVCSIISGRQGKCSEDCRFCAQSAHYPTGVACHELLPYEEIREHYRRQAQAGIGRSAIVTSGRRLSAETLAELCEDYRKLDAEFAGEVRLCASHGLLSAEDLAALKASGVKRYHNNLETSARFFPQICTTHRYEDKIRTLEAARQVGLELCSGGIFGLGETLDDRLAMAQDLRKLGVLSVPINILIPIPGTPLAHLQRLSDEEIARSVALYRFILPKARIRLAGGRFHLADHGRALLQGGADAVITGDMLTTNACDITSDRQMFAAMDRY